jgi:hypothetical protein
VKARDLHSKMDVGEFEGGHYTTTPIGGHDSRFLMFSRVATAHDDV